MAITNPEAIRFVSEQIRPLCEKIRAIKCQLVSMKADWDGHVGALIPNDTSALEDGRESEGVSRLTGADINNTRNTLAGLITAINDSVIQKPCVRSIEVN